MSSILGSHGMALATAMAVSGTVLLLTLCRQRPTISASSDHHPILLRSCITSAPDGKKREKNKKKMKKRVHFAEDVVDPVGNGEEFRREHNNNNNNKSLRLMENKQQGCRSSENSRMIQGMPANHMALYNGIRRDRLQRTACSY